MDVIFVGILYGVGAGVRDGSLCPAEVDGRGWRRPTHPLYLSTGDWQTPDKAWWDTMEQCWRPTQNQVSSDKSENLSVLYVDLILPCL